MGRWSVTMTVMAVALSLYTGNLCAAAEAGPAVDAKVTGQPVSMRVSGMAKRQSGRMMEKGVRPGDRMPPVVLHDMKTQEATSAIGRNHRAALLYMAQPISHSIQLDKKLQFMQDMQKK